MMKHLSPSKHERQINDKINNTLDLKPTYSFNLTLLLNCGLG
jgi:hypothetical protein